MKTRLLKSLGFIIFTALPVSSHATYSIIALDTTTHKTGVTLGTCIVDADDKIIPMVLQRDTSYISENGIFLAQGLIYNQPYILNSVKQMMANGTTAPLMISSLVNDSKIEYTSERQYTSIIKDGVQTSYQTHDGADLIASYASSYGATGNIKFIVAGNRLTDGTIGFLKDTFNSASGGLEGRLIATLKAMSEQSSYGDSECLKNGGKGTTNAYIKVTSGDSTYKSSLITSANFEVTSSIRSEDAVTKLLSVYDTYRRKSDYYDDVKLSNGQSYTTQAYAKNDSGTYFTAPYSLNVGSVTDAPQGVQSSTPGYSLISAIARHKTMQAMPIKLRVSNVDSSGRAFTMNSSTYSMMGLAGGKLRIEFNDDDNKSLPSGEYFIGLTIFADTEGQTDSDIQRIFIPLVVEIKNEVITLAGKTSGAFAASSRSWSETYQKADEICTQSAQLNNESRTTFGNMKFRALLSNRSDVVKPGVTYRRGGPWGNGIDTIINKNASATGHELVFNSSQEGTITPWGDRAWWGTEDHRWDCNMWSENYSGWVGANMDPGAKGINSIDRQWCDNQNYLVCVSTDELK